MTGKNKIEGKMESFDVGKVYTRLTENILILARTDTAVRGLVYPKDQFGEVLQIEFYPIQKNKFCGEFLSISDVGIGTYSVFACNFNEKDTERIHKEGIKDFITFLRNKADRLRTEAQKTDCQIEEIQNRWNS